ncbi:putative exported protein [Pectobacterium atrosepticum SCRI1043]|uniref:Exported protein n=1 Tax=Pectobacterium atrosepticum (strain SCRI 1043 / ATCC BAA-672) TaxID=218491 RepID=Q6D4C3_PECAS|nr:hypothetical protein [Pectobacterium atrosepticum]GKV85195.1 hypothetical protein PEC301296_15070 [Pectobacterium carotovorum subsp. carotovorum]AIA71274.1 hypothetical protein EV46_11890 [Pectobacterium atrosepticum]AIK13901.1 putative exported protein [Pectobacterium atrosepticum]ATY90733.1 hypothetical protein CVS35_10380 [Pectobacterium atrosepticum]KFX13951.1 hypothetical protein JV34_13035 [Pectobacterium atrosepticum]
MKKTSCFLLALAGLLVSITTYSATSPSPHTEETRIPAIKLINTPDNHSAFVTGSVPALEKITAQKFWLSNSTEAWEMNVHAAPRKQYVITLKGTLKFRVSDGSTFLLSPGTVLIAADTQGEGHSWEMVEGTEWVRIYIPIVEDNDYFIPNSSVTVVAKAH